MRSREMLFDRQGQTANGKVRNIDMVGVLDKCLCVCKLHVQMCIHA